MKLVAEAKRHKQVFRMSVDEFKKGEWLKQIPESDLLEVQYKKYHLTINNAILLKVRTEKEGESNDRK